MRLTAALEKVPSDAFAQIWCDDVDGPTETCANCAAVRTTVLDAFSGAPLSRRALDPSLAMSSMRQVTAGIRTDRYRSAMTTAPPAPRRSSPAGYVASPSADRTAPTRTKVATP